jgi:phage terminase large subunit-like protein
LSFLEERALPNTTAPGLNLLPANSASSRIERKIKSTCSPQSYTARKYSKLGDPVYLRDRYLTLQMGTKEIATEVGCTKQAVYKALRSHGIESRSHSQAWWASAERGRTKWTATSINNVFFAEWSPAAAYVFGVILTDGNLHLTKMPDGSVRYRSGTVHISQKEPELLDKVAKLIGHSGKLTFQPRREYQGRVAGELYTVSFSSDRVVADLVRLGLRPRKSLTLQFPDVPADMLRHFIRGCWDGDGSVYIDKNSKRICASYISGSLQFVEAMVRNLVDAGLPERTIHHHKRKTPSHYFRYTDWQVPMLYHYLYNDVSETEYLERKFHLFRLSLEMNSS